MTRLLLRAFRTSSRSLVTLAGLALLIMNLPGAYAHQVSHAYLAITQPAGEAGRRELQWDIPLRDLDMVLDLDADRDGALTHGEIRAGSAPLADLIGRALTIAVGNETCRQSDLVQSLYRHADGVHARLDFTVDCPVWADPPTLRYTLFADFDPSHRVIIEQGGQIRLLGTGQTMNLADNQQTGEPNSLLDRLGGFVRSGIHHILIGWDHLAFLLALLIASTLAPGRPSRRLALASPKGARANLEEVFWSVTAFTLAHSVTLSLAALGYLSLPPGPVEAAIAASVVLAAAANLYQRQALPAPLLAFAFGLIHGLGFASVMIESGAVTQSLALGLFGFNLGVELGQLAFVALVLPLFMLLGRREGLARWSAAAMSLALMAVGMVWFAERVTDLGAV